MSKAVGAEIRLEPLLDVILTKAKEVMEAERSSFFAYDEPSGTLSILLSQDLAHGTLKIPLGVGIAGHVAASREPLNVPDAYADPRFNRDADRESGFVTRSILCAPALTHSGRLIGVIQVLNKKDTTVFSEQDERLLAAFASIAGVALDRAHLIEEVLEKEKIESSLRLAHGIQMGMLPTRFPERAEVELYAALRLAKSVGGDLYDFRLEGDELWFVVGDVSGKGIPAALFMAVTKVLFGASLERESSPAAVMSRMNRELFRDNAKGLFVTAFLGRLDLATGELVYANAGHNPPYRIAADGTVIPLETQPGLVLGIREEYTYEAQAVTLAKGESVYAYTDGVPEALDAAEAAFSDARLEAFLGASRGASARELVEGSLAALEEFVGAAPQFDDITVLALRRLTG